MANTDEDDNDIDLVQKWCDINKIHRFEGDSGLKDLEKLVAVIGYRGHGFKYGSPIEQFLSDNPGACEAIVEFIQEWVPRNSEWQESLEDDMPEDEEGEDDEA